MGEPQGLHGFVDVMHRGARAHTKGEVLEAGAMPRIVPRFLRGIKKRGRSPAFSAAGSRKLVDGRQIGLELQERHEDILVGFRLGQIPDIHGKMNEHSCAPHHRMRR